MKAAESVNAKIEVIVVFSNEDKELVQNVNATVNSNNEIIVSSVMSDLKNKGYSIENLLVAYFCEERQMNVHIGRDPVPAEAVIPMSEKKRISLRFRQDSESHASADRIFAIGNSKQTVSVRSKERKISEILQKVAEWRRLYTGVRTKDGDVTQYSLEDAAKQVGISKKSLDDYLLQIKLGKRFGFDFNGNRDRGVGTLRSFVKKHRKNSGVDTPTKDSDDELPLQQNTREVFMKASYDKPVRTAAATAMAGVPTTLRVTNTMPGQVIAINQGAGYGGAQGGATAGGVQYGAAMMPQQITLTPEMFKNYQMMRAATTAGLAQNQYGSHGLVARTPIIAAGITAPTTNTTTTTGPALIVPNHQ